MNTTCKRKKKAIIIAKVSWPFSDTSVFRYAGKRKVKEFYLLSVDIN